MTQGKNTTGTRSNPNLWVIVQDPGTDVEGIWNDYRTFGEASKALKGAKSAATYGEADIMKRLDDGRLTAEY